MTRLIPWLILLAVTNSFAQTPSSIEAKTSDGRTVLLKSDGTWEFKRVPSEPQRSNTTPDRSIESAVSLTNFSGDDSRILFDRLTDLKKRLEKSEFETTAQFQVRITEEIKKPILGSRTLKDSFSLVISGVQAEYDADSQKMQLSIKVRKHGAGDEDRKTAYDLSHVNMYSIDLDQNGYGLQTIFFDDLNNLALSEKENTRSFSTELILGVEDAKRLKTTTRALAVVKFEEPYAEHPGSFHRQFQTRLIDVWFFEPQTGKILAKLSQAGK